MDKEEKHHSPEKTKTDQHLTLASNQKLDVETSEEYLPLKSEETEKENDELGEEVLTTDVTEENLEVPQPDTDETSLTGTASGTVLEDHTLPHTDEVVGTLEDGGVVPSKPAIAETRQKSEAIFQKELVQPAVVPTKKPSVQPRHATKKKPDHYTYSGSTKLLLVVAMLGALLGGGGVYLGVSNFRSLTELKQNQTALQENFLKDILTKENYTLRLRRELAEKEALLILMQRQNLSRLQREIRRNDNRSKITEDRLKRSMGRVARSCIELFSLSLAGNKSGVYYITHTPDKRIISKKVYCDLETDGGGWTVIQKRVRGSGSFFRPISDYISGFGDAAGSYFLGLEHIHSLTSSRKHSLRVELEDFDGDTAYAQYSSFSIGNISTDWELNVIGYTGTAGDSLSDNNGAKFSTFDHDKDVNPDVNCAIDFYGGWWYDSNVGCGDSNLNGRYETTDLSGRLISWHSWSSNGFIKRAEMKIKPLSGTDVEVGSGIASGSASGTFSG